MGYAIWFARIAKKKDGYYKPCETWKGNLIWPGYYISVLPSMEIHITMSNTRHPNAFKTGVLAALVSWGPSQGSGCYSRLQEQSSQGPRSQGGHGLRTVEPRLSETKRKGTTCFLRSPRPVAVT